ncbi:MAG TPA: glycosyltransferase family 9 protein [Oligoflexia bacterium]|nr:glycosyltransferase family 9 protein [Oligoflexia bacterium]
MKKILIIQLARFGDILQTLPSIQGLKSKYPECEITLLVRSTFRDAALLSPFVDHLIEFPTREILGPYFSEPSDDNKAVTLAHLIRFLANDFMRQKYDLCLNLTFSKSSSLLTQMITATEKRGLQRSRDHEVAVKDPWSQYFLAQVSNRNLNILHLNDLFARICGVEDYSYPVQLGATSMPRDVEAPEAKKKYLGIQIGASVAGKTLDVATWKTICEYLKKSFGSHTLVFFGSSDEKHSIHAIAPNESIVLAGKLRLQENVRWIRACEHIVTPDTAMVHLASLAGTNVINISLGGVRAQETGPYGEGHSVLIPKSPKSSDYAKAIQAIIAGDAVGTSFFHYKSTLRKTSFGSVRSELQNFNFQIDETRNFFEQSFYLLAEFRCAGRIDDLPIPVLRDSAHEPGSNAKSQVDRLLHAFDAMCALKKIGKMGQQFAVDLILHSRDKRSMKKLTRDLEELDRLMNELHGSSEYVRPLIDWVRVTRDFVDCSQNAQERLFELAGAQEGAYRELEQNVDILEQLLQTAVNAATKRVTKTSKSTQVDTKRGLDAE